MSLNKIIYLGNAQRMYLKFYRRSFLLYKPEGGLILYLLSQKACKELTTE